MQINELMIGDWVNIAVEEYNNPTRIRGIGSFWVKVIKDEMAYGNILVTPIPLTPEILKKNGFVEKSERRWVLSDEYTGDEVLVLYEVANAFAMTTEGMTIGLQNVHELQHLFKLCGIDKEIEL